MPASAALAYLKQNYILRMVSSPVLAAWKDGMIALSGKGWTVRLQTEDFLESFGHEEFAPLRQAEGIDEERDRQYYKWRSEKQ